MSDNPNNTDQNDEFISVTVDISQTAIEEWCANTQQRQCVSSTSVKIIEIAIKCISAVINSNNYDNLESYVTYISGILSGLKIATDYNKIAKQYVEFLLKHNELDKLADLLGVEPTEYNTYVGMSEESIACLGATCYDQFICSSIESRKNKEEH